MDLYRYFHPHHNPRLRNKPLRLQEIAELQQSVSELRKAIKRAEIRSESAGDETINSSYFSQILEATDYILDVLTKLTDKHPGDEIEQLKQMIEERKDAPGWENWTRLLNQRITALEKSRNAEVANS